MTLLADSLRAPQETGGRSFRTIETTGARLLEDIPRLYCLTCCGTGVVLMYRLDSDTWQSLPDRDEKCPDCEGRGF